MNRIENNLSHMHLQWFGDTDENKGSTDENLEKPGDKTDVTKDPKVLELIAALEKKNDEALQQASKDGKRDGEKEYQSVNDQLRTEIKGLKDKGLTDAEKVAARLEELELDNKNQKDLLQQRDWLESESRVATEKGLESGVLTAIRAIQIASAKRDPEESAKAIEALVAELKVSRDADVNKRLAGGKDETPKGGSTEGAVTRQKIEALYAEGKIAEADALLKAHPEIFSQE